MSHVNIPPSFQMMELNLCLKICISWTTNSKYHTSRLQRSKKRFDFWRLVMRLIFRRLCLWLQIEGKQKRTYTTRMNRVDNMDDNRLSSAIGFQSLIWDLSQIIFNTILISAKHHNVAIKRKDRKQSKRLGIVLKSNSNFWLQINDKTNMRFRGMHKK